MLPEPPLTRLLFTRAAMLGGGREGGRARKKKITDGRARKKITDGRARKKKSLAGTYLSEQRCERRGIRAGALVRS